MGKKGEKRFVWQSALTYVGTVIGAGFASGQEIWTFFGVFGYWGLAGTLLSGILFALLGKRIMKEAGLRRVHNYKEFFQSVLGRKACLFDAVIALYLLVGLAAMLTASGSVFAQLYGTALWKGFLFGAVLTYVFLLKGIEGLLWFNSLFVPGLILICLFVAGLAIVQAGYPCTCPNPLGINVGGGSWILSAFLYVAYNMVLGMVVLVSLEGKQRERSSRGGFIGGIILGLMATLICAALVFQDSFTKSQNLPMLELSHSISPFLGSVYKIVLLIAIFTTALSNGASLLKRLEGSTKCPRALTAGLIILPSFIFVNWPLAKVVGVVYPLLGYIGLIIIIAVIIRMRPAAKS